MISVLAGLKLVGGTSPYLGASCHLIFATGVPTLSFPPARRCVLDLKPLKQEDLFLPATVRSGAPAGPSGRPAPGVLPISCALFSSRGAGAADRAGSARPGAKASGVPAAKTASLGRKGRNPVRVHGGGPVREKFFRGNPLSRGGVGIRGMRSRDLKSRQDETRLVGPPLCVFSDSGETCKACA
jgi:hypothetical protein